MEYQGIYKSGAWVTKDRIGRCYAVVEARYTGTINVTSVYRCPKHNADVGGSLTSRHVLGKAFDFAQGSSVANWEVANIAYGLGQGRWEIILYTPTGRKNFCPDKTPRNGTYYHGHIGI